MGNTTKAFVPANRESKCEAPPPGWTCTRPGGHEGPCAAWRDLPGVSGVGRDAEHAKCLIVYFESEPDDEQLRSLHEWAKLRGPR
jgi:hypothetical protein